MRLKRFSIVSQHFVLNLIDGIEIVSARAESNDKIQYKVRYDKNDAKMNEFIYSTVERVKETVSTVQYSTVQ
jgi:hypothetical protein